MKKYRQTLLFKIYRTFEFYHGPGNETRHRRLAIVYAIAAWNAVGFMFYHVLSSKNIRLDPNTIEQAKAQGTFYTLGGSSARKKAETGETFPERPGETIV